MKLAWVNLFGVGLLVVLCTVQWRVNRNLNLKMIEREKLRLQVVERMNALDTQMSQMKEGIEEFRGQVEKTKDALNTRERDAAAAKEERDRLAGEREAAMAEVKELNAALQKWKAAVEERDAALKRVSQSVQDIVKERDEAIRRGNETVEKYNALVRRLKDAGATTRTVLTEQSR